MTALTPHEAADLVDQADLGVSIDSSDALRVLIDHARATDPAMGVDLAALREWVSRAEGEGDYDDAMCDVLAQIDSRRRAADSASEVDSREVWEAVFLLYSGDTAGKDAGALTYQERAALDVVLAFARRALPEADVR